MRTYRAVVINVEWFEFDTISHSTSRWLAAGPAAAPTGPALRIAYRRAANKNQLEVNINAPAALPTNARPGVVAA